MLLYEYFLSYIHLHSNGRQIPGRTIIVTRSKIDSGEYILAVERFLMDEIATTDWGTPKWLGLQSISLLRTVEVDDTSPINVVTL